MNLHWVGKALAAWDRGKLPESERDGPGVLVSIAIGVSALCFLVAIIVGIASAF